MTHIPIESLLDQMTLQEQVALLSGADFWTTFPVPRLDIPAVKVSDGPNGARGGIFKDGPSTACFPAGIALAATWNPALVQQAGGTTWQELSIALAEGHELLVKQLEQGIDCDSAASAIHFTFGIGSKYFFELAKIRAFRTCWAQIVSAYSPEYPASMAATITARTGFLNVSLKDPYTNLLRQTTEAMSAVLGGIQHLNIQPYDWYSTNPNTGFTRRMATNISLLLKEESYLQIVLDPAGGSYAIDALTETIAERAWSSFQWIERNGTISNPEVRKTLAAEIEEKAALRTSEIADKTEKRIGINIFPNPVAVTNSWTELPACWNNLKPLILEQTL